MVFKLLFVMMVMTICFGNDAISEQSAKPLMIPKWTIVCIMGSFFVESY